MHNFFFLEIEKFEMWKCVKHCVWMSYFEAPSFDCVYLCFAHENHALWLLVRHLLPPSFHQEMAFLETDSHLACQSGSYPLSPYQLHLRHSNAWASLTVNESKMNNGLYFTQTPLLFWCREPSYEEKNCWLGGALWPVGWPSFKRA